MFTWKPIYSELASALPAWRSRQTELIAILDAASKQGVPVSTLRDKDSKDKWLPLQVIDPFTFFAFFNRGIKKEHRLKLLELIKDKLHLKSPLPEDFKGIPVMFPQRTWFFSYQKDREPDAIDTLWDFAKAIVEQSPEILDGELFNRTLALQQVGLGNLTMGMFWMRPDQYLAVDKRNRAWLKKSGIEAEISDWPSYLNFLKQVKQQIPDCSWPELSLKAYQDDTGVEGPLKKSIGITDAPQPEIHPEPFLPARNIILYGPPGTGKTHRLRNEYMQKFTDRQAVLSTEERASALVEDLAWWEVAALALLDTKDNKASVAQILEHALVRARLKLSANQYPRSMLWASLQSHTKEDCSTVNYTKRVDPLLFSKDEASVWSVDPQLAKTVVPELDQILHTFRNPANEVPEVRRYEFTTFHQSFSYEDFVEGIKPQMGEGQFAYDVRDGIFKEICQRAAANPDKPYAIFIDEINRGNVANILGELITLIEEDKRLGAANQITPKLPYSRLPFGVPQNLYIIGTMNTADRSVEALDTALRRRFTFVEMRPNPSLIENPPLLAVDLRQLLVVINARIEQLLDHDHCIGHAYFMEIKDLDGLRSTFANKIIPLLREYFYGSPAKVGMVLGERFVLRQTAKTPFATGSWGADQLDEKEVFKFADPYKLRAEDFQAIYESGPGI